MLCGNAIRAPTRIVIVESLLDCPDCDLVGVRHRILVKILVVNRLGIAARAPEELRCGRPLGRIHPYIASVALRVPPALHIFFLKDELERVRIVARM